jgi:hypothetical protein
MDIRYGHDPGLIEPVFVQWRKQMRVPDFVLKAGHFIGVKERGKFYPRATAFVISIEDRGSRFPYLVTAEHVISGLITKGHRIFLRTNITGGGARETDITDWRWAYHPANDKNATDVAVTPINFKADEEFDPIPINGERSIAGTAEVLTKNHIGIGDEIFMVGLFRSHYGQQKNIPVVRIGNIAMMKGEPVLTKYCGYTEGYLVEARSISGLSGSPVIVSLPPVRIIDRETKFLAGQNQFYLLGLMHGHFDISNLNEDTVADDETTATTGINTGMGVVIPVEKIIETINQPDLQAERERVAREIRE